MMNYLKLQRWKEMMGDDFWRSVSSQAKRIDQNSKVSASTWVLGWQKGYDIYWLGSPLADFLKINVDGAHNSQTERSGWGGIICDSNGGFVKGFVCNLGPCNVLKAEMLTLLHGIQVARNLFIRKNRDWLISGG